MSNERFLDGEDDLAFLDPRVRELLRRLARADRRDELQELATLIEDAARTRASGAKDNPLSPAISLEGLPEVRLVEKVFVRPGAPRAGDKDAPPPGANSGR